MTTRRLSDRVWQEPAFFLAFGFGSGLSPVAPGTMGTLVAIPLYLILSRFSCVTSVLVILGILVVGTCVSGVVSRALRVHDHPGIVIDEIAGYLLTMLAAPPGIFWMVAGFLLFRFFDILKPFPVRFADRTIRGGFGIMLDDVLAAGYAAIVLVVLRFFLQ